MKKIALALVMVGLAACGTHQSTSTAKDAVIQRPALDPVVVQGAKLVFSRDKRPVDGDLKELTLTKNDDGTYDVTLHTAYFDEIHGQPVDKTESLASGLRCLQFGGKYVCSRDSRPVDGDLKELTIAKNDHGSYDAKLRTAYFDRINGQAVDQTKDIALDLNRR